MIKYFSALFLVGCLLSGCQLNKDVYTKSGLDPHNFDKVVNGKQVALYTLTNDNGVEACITNYGGRLVSLMVPDKDGEFRDVVLGHDSIDDYMNIDSNFGAIIGRYANRISHGHFAIDGNEYQLPQNDFGHCLHGGPKGFHHSVWTAKQCNDSTLELSLTSPDGEWGFPGNINVDVTYTLTSDNAISISYSATTDAPTVLNLTNHSYFNLSGNPANNILDELVWFNATGYTPIDSSFMTTGEILPIEGTPFDFSSPTAIGARIKEDNIQLHNGLGYDHNMVLCKPRNFNTPAASVKDPESGIIMEVYTNEPGIQFYVGNFLDGSIRGKKGIAYPHRSALCLETQHFPDSPNKPHWDSVIIRPGQTYHSYCSYRFSHE